MIVQMWMSRNPLTLEVGDTLADAARMMLAKNIRRIPVCKKGKLVGMVSRSDVLGGGMGSIEGEAQRQSSPKVESVMSRSVISVETSTPIEDVARLLLEHKIGALPVLRKDTLVGIISDSDVFRAIVGALTPSGEAVRVTFELPSKLATAELLPALSSLAERHMVHLNSYLQVAYEGSLVCVVRVVGAPSQDFIDALWKIGFKILNVTRYDARGEEKAA